MVRFDLIESGRGGGKLPGWYWRVRSAGGRVLAVSDVRDSHGDARREITKLVAEIRGEHGDGVELVTYPIDSAERRAAL